MAIEEFVPGATGIIKSALDGGADLVQALSNGIQRSNKVGFLNSFIDEWEKMKEKGRAPSDFTTTEIGTACLQELMDFLEKEMPQKTRIEAMKQLFFKAANVDTEQSEKVRCLQLMKVCRELDATELLILSVVNKENERMHNSAPTITGTNSAESWPRDVARASDGALSEGIVDHYEDRLVSKKLIGERLHSDRSGIRFREQFRLTQLGLELGAFLKASEE